MKKLPVLPSERDLENCVTQLKVLADPTRLAVIRLLLAEPLNVNSLSSELGVEQSLLSHHLKVLRDAQLVASSRQGKQVIYRVADGVEKSFMSAESIDLGCCKLSFADEPAKRPQKR